VLSRKTELRTANERTAISPFSSERLEARFDPARTEMMQAADSWNLDHMTERGRLDRSADGRIFFE
jgi:hypothetical protein